MGEAHLSVLKRDEKRKGEDNDKTQCHLQSLINRGTGCDVMTRVVNGADCSCFYFSFSNNREFLELHLTKLIVRWLIRYTHLVSVVL